MTIPKPPIPATGYSSAQQYRIISKDAKMSSSIASMSNSATGGRLALRSLPAQLYAQ
jgi:hypothetical protein